MDDSKKLWNVNEFERPGGREETKEAGRITEEHSGC